MTYPWNWFGATNLAASVLFLVMAFLFLRARRSDVTVAIALLSRLVGRLAERTVLVGPAAGRSDERATGLYTPALRTAVIDGHMSREREEHLTHVQAHLSLGRREALRLRRAVEDEMAESGGGG